MNSVTKFLPLAMVLITASQNVNASIISCSITDQSKNEIKSYIGAGLINLDYTKAQHLKKVIANVENPTTGAIERTALKHISVTTYEKQEKKFTCFAPKGLFWMENKKVSRKSSAALIFGIAGNAECLEGDSDQVQKFAIRCQNSVNERAGLEAVHSLCVKGRSGELEFQVLVTEDNQSHDQSGANPSLEYTLLLDGDGGNGDCSPVENERDTLMCQTDGGSIKINVTSERCSE